MGCVGQRSWPAPLVHPPSQTFGFFFGLVFQLPSKRFWKAASVQVRSGLAVKMFGFFFCGAPVLLISCFLGAFACSFLLLWWLVSFLVALGWSGAGGLSWPASTWLGHSLASGVPNAS